MSPSTDVLSGCCIIPGLFDNGDGGVDNDKPVGGMQLGPLLSLTISTTFSLAIIPNPTSCTTTSKTNVTTSQNCTENRYVHNMNTGTSTTFAATATTIGSFTN